MSDNWNRAAENAFREWRDDEQDAESETLDTALRQVLNLAAQAPEMRNEAGLRELLKQIEQTCRIALR